MAKKLKQTYPIKDNGVNGEGGTRQAAARMKEEEEGRHWNGRRHAQGRNLI